MTTWQTIWLFFEPIKIHDTWSKAKVRVHKNAYGVSASSLSKDGSVRIYCFAYKLTLQAKAMTLRKLQNNCSVVKQYYWTSKYSISDTVMPEKNIIYTITKNSFWDILLIISSLPSGISSNRSFWNDYYFNEAYRKLFIDWD